MIQDLVDLAIGANRVLSYAGYVLLAGTLTFWSVVWPDGQRNRRLVVLALTGTAAMIIGTLAGPAIQLIFGGRLLGDTGHRDCARDHHLRLDAADGQ